MKKVDLKCNGCGAPMQLSQDNSYAECPYCKNKVLLKNELSLEEQTKRAEELSYAKEKGEIRANEEALKKQKRQKRRTVFIVIFILVGLGVFSLLSSYYSKELIEEYENYAKHKKNNKLLQFVIFFKKRRDRYCTLVIR